MSQGYRRGAEKIEEVLGWCDESGVGVVTLWLLSTDNLVRSEPTSSNRCCAIIEDVVDDLAAPGPAVAALASSARSTCCPPETVAVLKAATEADVAAGPASAVNVAVGYGGRREIADAVRSLLHEHAALGTSIEELAEILDVDHIAEHLYTRGQPDPDLVIRTSGEQRLSGFLLWQSAHSEFYFCDAYWPDFRRVDFLRALRDYAARHRRFGG